MDPVLSRVFLCMRITTWNHPYTIFRTFNLNNTHGLGSIAKLIIGIPRLLQTISRNILTKTTPFRNGNSTRLTRRVERTTYRNLWDTYAQSVQELLAMSSTMILDVQAHIGARIPALRMSASPNGRLRSHGQHTDSDVIPGKPILQLTELEPRTTSRIM
ncbi:hypothetical protein M422DRAFT_23409 [Sphaerobolus stellatus SS14]|nr:hypothetical protein M422DRAFT_23409 [Sphaerobolus stellatus SS14]